MSGASIEQAIAALAGGRPVQIGSSTLLSVEMANNHTLDRLDPDGTAAFVISASRAAALGLGNERDVVPGHPIRIAHCEWLGRSIIRSIADPGRDFERMIPGPLSVTAPADEEAAKAGLRLARLAGLLPALWEVDAADDAIVFDPVMLDTPPNVSIAARARLPIDGIDDAQVIAFREAGTGHEHVALVIGAFGGSPPLARLHSECLTGDVFGSLKCDCGPQLKEALRLIDAAGSGILLYLRQEGRGIGLANKIRAYALQDRGLDTVDANRRLGFGDDERDYQVAGAMLRALGVDEVRLLTNNPAKVEGLEQAGITVVERVAHHMPVNPHNADYIATKRSRSGHLD